MQFLNKNCKVLWYPTLICGFAHVATLIFGMALFVCLPEYITEHLRLLDCAEEMVPKNFWVDHLALTHEHIVYFEETGFDNLDILVQFKVATGAAFRHGALLVPVLRDDTATDIHFRYLPAHGYADEDWILAVAEGAGFPCYERQGEIRIM